MNGGILTASDNDKCWHVFMLYSEMLLFGINQPLHTSSHLSECVWL
jgi:hypothetical protein